MECFKYQEFHNVIMHSPMYDNCCIELVLLTVRGGVLGEKDVWLLFLVVVFFHIQLVKITVRTFSEDAESADQSKPIILNPRK